MYDVCTGQIRGKETQSPSLCQEAERMKRMLTLSSGASVHPVSLDQSHEDDLGGQGGDDGLCVHQGGVAQVVEPVLVEDLGAGLEPGGLLKLDSSVFLQQLWGHAPKGAQHSLQGALTSGL